MSPRIGVKFKNVSNHHLGRHLLVIFFQVAPRLQSSHNAPRASHPHQPGGHPKLQKGLLKVFFGECLVICISYVFPIFLGGSFLFLFPFLWGDSRCAQVVVCISHRKKRATLPETNISPLEKEIPIRNHRFFPISLGLTQDVVLVNDIRLESKII